MTSTRRFFALVSLVLVIGLTAAAASLPARLNDQDFWRLVSESSESDGSFRSDNLLSNELGFQYVVPDLVKTTKPGRVYMGVGPEQNFTYIVATKPAMAFIVDIRRGNLDLQLMYKALFELSKDRAEFVSRLFSKPQPDGLGADSTALQIFGAYSKVPASEALYKENLKAIQDHLVQKHAFPLAAGDLEGIDYVFSSFYRYGPDINYSSTQGGGGFGRVTYEELMVATDEMGQARSYLANEENFAFLKNMQAKNLVIPVIGNFNKPKAIRAVASYLKGIDATVSAFYLSNVEQYLRQDGILRYFCANAAALPLDQTSTFIRSVRGGRYGLGTGLNSDLGNMTSELKGCSDIR